MNLFKAELLRFYREAKVYYADALVSLCTNILLYVIVYLNNPEIGIEAYMLWIIAQNILTEASISISTEKQLGTLQNIMTKPAKLVHVIITRILIWIGFGIIKACIFFLVLFPFAGAVHTNLLTTVLVYIVTCLGMIGPGLIIASMTLIYTKVASFESILNYVLLVISGILIAVPDWVACTNPLSAGVSILNTSLNAGNFGILCIVSILWFALGYFFFIRVFDHAKSFRWTY